MERNERGVGVAEMSSEARTTATEPVTGHVPVNGLQMHRRLTFLETGGTGRVDRPVLTALALPGTPPAK